MSNFLQVDGHPVRGWDEKALLAHVMGEEGERGQCSISSNSRGYSVAMVLIWSACRYILQHRV
jgi:hypothetical protein